MKRNFLKGAFVLSAIAVLFALAGCDTAVDSDHDDGNWLKKENNPFIGTWGYSSTSMMGVVTDYELEFKTDSTIVQKVTSGGSTTESILYYLIKDKYIVISSASGYTKYQFEIPNNRQITIVANANPTYYTRVGAENPRASRIFNLPNGLEGYWRSSTLTFGTEESSTFMYDWYTFNKNGTYHVYHYMNKNKHYIDRGEFSYYIDGNNRLVTLNRLYDVTVYYDFIKDGDDAFSWKTTEGGSVLGFERFNGETFWHAAGEGMGDHNH